MEGWKAPDGTTFPVQVFVLTHQAQPTVTHRVTTFNFVMDGIESAVSQAHVAAASHKNVSIMGASIAQQCLKAGLLDEIIIHLVPVILGMGSAYLKMAAPKNLELESTEVTETPAVIHLGFRVHNNQEKKKEGMSTAQSTSVVVGQVSRL